MAAPAQTPTFEAREERSVARQLTELEARLVERYVDHPTVSSQRIREIVRVASDRLADARVHAFVPILVERAALRALEGS